MIDEKGYDPALPRDLRDASVRAAERHRHKDDQLEDKLASLDPGHCHADPVPDRIAKQVEPGGAVATIEDIAFHVQLAGKWLRDPEGRDGVWEPVGTYSKRDLTRLTNALHAVHFRPLGRGTVDGVRQSYWAFPAAQPARTLTPEEKLDAMTQTARRRGRRYT